MNILATKENILISNLKKSKKIKNNAKNIIVSDDTNESKSPSKNVSISSDVSCSKNNDSSLVSANDGKEEDLITYNDFTHKEKHYYDILNDFFTQCSQKELDIMHDIVSEKSISLRKYEWFAIRYSYYYKTSINIDNRFMNEKIKVHISYKAHLKTYHKEYFDPFRRSDKDKSSRKFIFNVEGKRFNRITSISQLHFVRWILTHDIVKYVTNNYEKIMGKRDDVDKYFSEKSERSKKSKNNKNDNSTCDSNKKSNDVTVRRGIQFCV